MEKETCPQCGGDCKLLVDLDTAMTAKLDDRLMALTPIEAKVECLDCGLSRQAVIDGFDVSLVTGKLEFGQIEFREP